MPKEVTGTPPAKNTQERFNETLGNILEGAKPAVPKMLVAMWPLGLALVFIVLGTVIARRMNRSIADLEASRKTKGTPRRKRR